MYSGTIVNTKSGRALGVHQKIDRIARRNVMHRVPHGMKFPTTKQILHFEGLHGPDGIKKKSPGRDEPWHFVDPNHIESSPLLDMVDDHIHNLRSALEKGNFERAAFEAAWMSHAVTDGLTPAHHYPLSEKIEELWGKSHDERLTLIEKNLVPGENWRQVVAKTWEYRGAGGVFTAHYMFEWGVATTISPYAFEQTNASDSDIDEMTEVGYRSLLTHAIQFVDSLQMYEEFVKKGWNRHLANQTRQVLIPEIIRMVELGWLAAMNPREIRR